MDTTHGVAAKNRRSLRFCRALSALLCALGLISAARAELLSYGADVGIGETDNVTLSGSDKTSQTMAVADLEFALKEQTRLLDLNARGNFSYLDYLQNAYGNQFVGRFDGVGRGAIIPERLTWTVQDDFGQSSLDPFTPTTPNNIENVNYFSTGPDLALRLGGTSYLNVSARYARASYETSPFSSNRLIGQVAWGLQLSASTSFSVHADTERVLFQNTVVNQDFTRTTVYAEYSLQGARTTLSANLGATRVDQGGDTMNGAFARLQLERTISRASKLVFAAGRDLTDAVTSFSGLTTGAIGIVGTAPAAQTSASYTSTFASAGWQWQRNRTTVALSGRWQRNEYDNPFSQFDYTQGGAEARVERKLTHRFTAEINGHAYKTKYPNANLGAGVVGSNDYTDSGVGGALTWRHGRGLEIKLRAEHTSRNGSGLDASYHENRAFLTIGYRPRPMEMADMPINENPASNENPGAKAPGGITNQQP